MKKINLWLLIFTLLGTPIFGARATTESESGGGSEWDLPGEIGSDYEKPSHVVTQPAAPSDDESDSDSKGGSNDTPAPAVNPATPPAAKPAPTPPPPSPTKSKADAGDSDSKGGSKAPPVNPVTPPAAKPAPTPPPLPPIKSKADVGSSDSRSGSKASPVNPVTLTLNAAIKKTKNGLKPVTSQPLPPTVETKAGTGESASNSKGASNDTAPANPVTLNLNAIKEARNGLKPVTPQPVMQAKPVTTPDAPKAAQPPKQPLKGGSFKPVKSVQLKVGQKPVKSTTPLSSGTRSNVPVKQADVPQFPWTQKKEKQTIKVKPDTAENNEKPQNHFVSQPSPKISPIQEERAPQLPPDDKPDSSGEKIDNLPRNLPQTLSDNLSQPDSDAPVPPMDDVALPPVPAAPPANAANEVQVPAAKAPERTSDVPPVPSMDDVALPPVPEAPPANAANGVQVPAAKAPERTSDVPPVPSMDEAALPPVPAAPPANAANGVQVPAAKAPEKTQDSDGTEQVNHVLSALHLKNAFYLLGGCVTLAAIAEVVKWSCLTAASQDMQTVKEMVTLAKDNKLEAAEFDKLAKQLTLVSQDSIEAMRNLVESDIYAAIGFMNIKVLEDLQKQHDAQGILSRLRRGATIRSNQVCTLGKAAIAKTKALFTRNPASTDVSQ